MYATAKKISRIIIRVANTTIDFIVLTVILLLIAVAVYAIWDSEQIYHAASAVQYEIYKPNQMQDQMSFKELQGINPEVIGWLDVYGTNIDYPITQGDNNTKYVNTNVFGEYSLSGAIFLDYLNSKNFQDFNSILYGHHMEKSTMFGELSSFGSKQFFDNHRYGNLYYSGQDHGLEFFAFIKTDAYDNSIFAPRIKGEEAQRVYLQNLFDKATYSCDINVTISDHILLLTTCSSESTNGRDILAAKIADENFNNPFDVEEPVKTKQVSVDQQGDYDSFPIWLKIMLPIILLILLGAIIIRRKG